MGKNPLFMLILSMIISLPLNVVAVEPSEILQNPQLEIRARNLSQNIRCLVCQNQSIDDSDSKLAKDLRLMVRERLVAGDSKESVIKYIVSRYGEFVLLMPPFKFKTLFLWFGPLLFMIIGLIFCFFFFKRAKPISILESTLPKPLTLKESRRIKKILEGDEND